MSLGRMDRGGGRLLAWTFALALVLTLIGLFAATSESLRRQERRPPSTEVVEPEPALQESEADEVYHGPGVAAWPTP